MRVELLQNHVRLLSALFAMAIFSVMCWEKQQFLSKFPQSTLLVWVWGIGVGLGKNGYRKIWRGASVFLLKYVTEVLSGWEKIRHLSSHWLVAVNSVWRTLVRWSSRLARANWVTSSAYWIVRESGCVGSGRSDVYMLKRVGERTEPCGTPASGVKEVDSDCLCLILMCLSVRKLQRSFWNTAGRSKLLQILYLIQCARRCQTLV